MDYFFLAILKTLHDTGMGHGDVPNPKELKKSNLLATQLRIKGDELFKQEEWIVAMERYIKR